ncbi:MAG: YqgE/AlgH family protein [Acidimicrobiales bacterium]|jgi:putative transcriptional regulator
MVGVLSKGSLLVASPTLADPNFFRSVVFILAHDDVEGSLGVVLNRPSPIPVDEIVPGWGGLAASPSVLFIGGPVQPSAAICIGRTELKDTAEAAGFAPLFGDLGTVDLHEDPIDVPVPLAEVRVFTGYAGWGPGQLANEVDSGSWHVLIAQDQDVLSGDPEGLWGRVLRRQGGWLAVLALYPTDLGSN